MTEPVVTPASPAPVVKTESSGSAPVWMQPPPPAPAQTEPVKAAAEPAKPADGKAPTEPVKTEAAPPKPVEVVPIKLKVPDGMKMEPAQLEKYEADMKALGVTQDVAEKLLLRDLQAEKAAHEAGVAEIKATNDKWGQQLKVDLGSNFIEASEMAKRGFDFVDPDFSMRKELEAAQLHNYPRFFRAMEKVGRMLHEDKLHAQSGAVPEKKLSAEERLKKGYQERMAAGAKK